MGFEFGGDLANQVAASAGEIGESGHDPDGRGAEGDQADHFDAIPCGAADREIIGQFSGFGIGAVHLGHLFDEEAQRVLDQILVKARAADRRRNCHAGQFVEQARRYTRGRAHQPFWNRKKVVADAVPECHSTDIVAQGAGSTGWSAAPPPPW